MAKIAQRGRLIAGVSADTYLLGSRNPFNGRIEGFDIDLVKAMAKAIFGDENRYELRVITAAQRIPTSAERVGGHGRAEHDDQLRPLGADRLLQRVLPLGPEDPRPPRLEGDHRSPDLAGQRVCAPNGTSSMDNLEEAVARRPIAVGADSHTGCLVLFQQGAVDAITGDDTVLAGLAAQDPYADGARLRRRSPTSRTGWASTPGGRPRAVRQRPAGGDAQQRRVDRHLRPMAAAPSVRHRAAPGGVRQVTGVNGSDRHGHRTAGAGPARASRSTRRRAWPT